MRGLALLATAHDGYNWLLGAVETVFPGSRERFRVLPCYPAAIAVQASIIDRLQHARWHCHINSRMRQAARS